MIARVPPNQKQHLSSLKRAQGPRRADHGVVPPGHRLSHEALEVCRRVPRTSFGGAAACGRRSRKDIRRRDGQKPTRRREGPPSGLLSGASSAAGSLVGTALEGWDGLGVFGGRQSIAARSPFDPAGRVTEGAPADPSRRAKRRWTRRGNPSGPRSRRNTTAPTLPPRGRSLSPVDWPLSRDERRPDGARQGADEVTAFLSRLATVTATASTRSQALAGGIVDNRDVLRSAVPCVLDRTQQGAGQRRRCHRRETVPRIAVHEAARGGHHRARDLPDAEAQLRDAPHRGRRRHSHRAGAARAGRRLDRHDLFPDSRPRRRHGRSPGRTPSRRVERLLTRRMAQGPSAAWTRTAGAADRRPSGLPCR